MIGDSPDPDCVVCGLSVGAADCVVDGMPCIAVDGTVGGIADGVVDCCVLPSKVDEGGNVSVEDKVCSRVVRGLSVEKLAS